MRAILDRHAELLTPAERRGLWGTIAGAGAREPRPVPRRALSAMAAVLATGVITFAVLHREPAGPPHSGPARPGGVAPTTPEARHAAPSIAQDLPAPSKPIAPDRETRPMERWARRVFGGRATVAPSKPLDRRLAALDGDEQMASTSPADDLGKVARQIEEIDVQSERRIDTRASSTKQTISAEKLRELPVNTVGEPVATKAGVVSQNGELHLRGGRAGEVRFQFDGVTPSDPLFGSRPVTGVEGTAPTAGGTALPNDARYDAMYFKNYGVNPRVSTEEDSLSTFAVDVDAGSYTLARSYLQNGSLPPAEAVRVEEFVNFFPQGYPGFQNDDFRILVDGAPSPFGSGYYLLRIGLKGREVAERNRKPAQLTFVIDVSGSMADGNRLETVKQALHLLVEQLYSDDRIGILAYGSNGRVVLEPTGLGRSSDSNEENGRDLRPGRARILAAIDRLRPDGSTNAEEGLRLGYDMARRAYRSGATNRIVLCSDGVANVGVTGPESILARVRSEADHGIHLTTVGFGMGNYNDVLMEQLADQGDGNYYYVDDLAEAHRVFEESLTGTLETIAKDAKIQVEFHRSRVQRYRLLGFENRDVADRDFRNDRVDAGEIGAGHEVTALYEVKLVPGAEDEPLATVRLRYAKPDDDEDRRRSPDVREIAKDVSDDDLSASFADAAPRFRLDAAVAEFAEILRGSYWAKGERVSDVIPIARRAARELNDEATSELVKLIETASRLVKPVGPEEPPREEH